MRRYFQIPICITGITMLQLGPWRCFESVNPAKDVWHQHELGSRARSYGAKRAYENSPGRLIRTRRIEFLGETSSAHEGAFESVQTLWVLERQKQSCYMMVAFVEL